MVPINYLAVLVSAIVTMITGYLWYGPLFGKEWSVLMGWSPERMAQMQTDPAAKKKVQIGYGLQFVGSLLMAYVLAHAIVFASAYMSVSGVMAGLEAGLANWVGFVAPVTIGVVLWDGKPWKLWFINAGYYLVNLLLMGIILGAWA